MSFDPVNIPVIETERLILRGWRLSDLDCFMEIYADPEHSRFVSRVSDRSQAFEKMSSVIGHWQLRGWGRFAVEDKATSLFVGHCGASQLDSTREPELNYSFTPSVSGKGYATEAVRTVLGYLYQDHGWKTAVSEIHINNARSRAVAQRLGALLDGQRDTGEFGILQIWRYPSPHDFFKSNQSNILN